MNRKRHTIENRQSLIAKAGIIALAGNLILAVAKLFVGIMSGSLAVLGDGIDTTTDVIIAALTLIIGKIISRPSDASHPWGHARAETMGTLVLSFVILFAGVQLGLSAIHQLNNLDATVTTSKLALIVTGASVIIKAILAVTQYILGNMANSSMIKANAQNMLNDIVISGSVLIGLFLVHAFDAPIWDPLIALFVSIWIIKNAISIFWDMNVELMDGTTDNEVYRQLFDAVKSVKGVSNPHRVRMRKIANYWDVDLDIEVSGTLTVFEAHEKAEQVSYAIHQSIPDIYDIMVHVEPEGLSEIHGTEGYGLQEKDLIS